MVAALVSLIVHHINIDSSLMVNFRKLSTTMDCGVKQRCKLALTLYGLYAAIVLWIAFKDDTEHSIYVPATSSTLED